MFTFDTVSAINNAYGDIIIRIRYGLKRFQNANLIF